MARFFVGQRVKLVRPYNPQYAGLEGVITAIGPYKKFDFVPPQFYSVADCDLLVFYGHEDAPTCTDWHQIEPLTTAHEPCEYDFKESLDKLLEGLPA